jgi:hypothetical protein
LSWLDLENQARTECSYAQVLGLDGYAAVPRAGLGPMLFR